MDTLVNSLSMVRIKCGLKRILDNMRLFWETEVPESSDFHFWMLDAGDVRVSRDSQDLWKHWIPLQA
jgi:hypothetical protein